MSETTSVTATSASMTELFRRGDAIKMTPDVDGVGVKVVCEAFATYLTVRDVRWYDYLRWWAQAAWRWARRAILRLFAGAAP